MARLRTVQECYEAGLRDGRDDPPLSQEQISRLVVLLQPALPERKAS